MAPSLGLLLLELKGPLQRLDEGGPGLDVLPPLVEVVDADVETVVAGSKIVAVESTSPCFVELLDGDLGGEDFVLMCVSHSVQKMLELVSESRDLPEPISRYWLWSEAGQRVLGQLRRPSRTCESERSGIGHSKCSLDLYSGRIAGHRATFVTPTRLRRSVVCDYAVRSPRGISCLHPSYSRSEAATSGRVRIDPCRLKIHRAELDSYKFAEEPYSNDSMAVTAIVSY